MARRRFASLSLLSDSGCLDPFTPKSILVFYEGGELFGRAAKRVEAQLRKASLGCRGTDDLVDSIVQHLDHVGRHARWPKVAIPGINIEVRHADQIGRAACRERVGQYV